MSLFFNRIYFQNPTIGGGLRQVTPKVRGLIRHIIVKANTSTTTFDFYISDGSSLHLFERESVDGEINETVQIPVQSNLELIVSGATADELFKLYMAIQEI